MSKSRQLFEQAQHLIPGGVNSPVRAFGAVGGIPPFIRQAKGAYLYDEDDNQYIDYVGSWGPMILGHADQRVIQAVTAQVDRGLSFGMPTMHEVTLAKMIIALMPSIQKIRMVNSGTEATMSAIRLARGFTGRDKLIKFEGCYHGHADSLLVKAGSGALTFGTPSSPGVPADTIKHTLTATFNDLDSVSTLFEANPQEIAAIIVEPFAGNMNFVRPQPGFLQGLRELCDQYGALLIMDEVMTGFRVALKGAQSLEKIRPDLTCLGKVIGGGMPVGAFGGRTEIMDQLSPQGPVYQAGTLSGNPVAMAAGIANLTAIQTTNFFEELNQKTHYLVNGIQKAADAAGIRMCSDSEGGMFGLFFTDQPAINCFADVMRCDTQRFNRFFNHLLSEGHFFAPSAYEAGFVSQAHTLSDLDNTIASATRFFQMEAKTR